MTAQPPVACVACKLSFKTTSDLSRHLCPGPQIHPTRSDVHQCTYCRRVYKTHGYLVRHMATCAQQVDSDKRIPTSVHGTQAKPKKDITCVTCGKIIPNIVEYKKHRAAEHMQLDEKLSCNLCGVDVTDFGELRDHARLCPKRLPSNHEIPTHLNPTRTQTPPMRGKVRSHRDRFVCGNCHVRFSSQLAFNQHKYGANKKPEDKDDTEIFYCQFWQWCAPDMGPKHTKESQIDRLCDAGSKFVVNVNELQVTMCISCRCLFAKSAMFANKPNLKNYAANVEKRQKCGIQAQGLLCSLCYNSVKLGKTPSVIWTNELQTDFPPLQIQELKPLELKFIAQVTPMVDMVMLGKYENYGVRGVCRTYLSNIQESCRQKNIPNYGCKELVVNFGGNNLQYARNEYIQDALSWLSHYNQYYWHIDPSQHMAAAVPGSEELHYEWFEPSVLCPKDPKAEFPDAMNKPVMTDPETLLEITKPQKTWSLYQDPYIEYKAFPELFCLARGGWGEERHVKLTFNNYIRSKLLSENDIFRLSPKYLCWLKTEKENKTISGVCSLVLVQKRTQMGTEVSKKHLSEAKKRSENRLQSRRGEQRATVHDTQGLMGLRQETCETMLHWFGFCAEIPGTGPYWQQELMDLYARIATVGPPRLFLTFSIDSFGWEDLDALRAMCRMGKFTSVRNWIREDPLPSTRHSHKRFQELLKFIKNGKPLGDIKYWYFRYEIQGRGALHTHGVLWLEDDSLFDHETPTQCERLKNYLDKIICGRQDPRFPRKLNELIHRVQKHTCGPKCYKNSKATKTCGFPRDIAQFSKLAEDFINGKTCRRIFIPQRGPGDIAYNEFNCALLLFWQANMDIQVLIDTYAVMRYLAGYISKPESQALNDACKDTRMLRYAEGQRLSLPDMLNIYSIIMSHEDVSSTMLVLRALGIPLVNTNLHVDQINMRFPQFTYRRIKPNASRLEMEASDREFHNTPVSEEQNANDDPTQDGHDGSEEQPDQEEKASILFDGKLEKYRKRAIALEHLCLYEFCKDYTIFKVNPQNRDHTTHPWLSTDGSFYVKKTTNCKALRLQLGYVNTQEYYFGLLSCFVPFRDQDEFRSTEYPDYKDLLKNILRDDKTTKDRLETVSYHQYVLNAVAKLQLQDVYNNLLAGVVDATELQKRLDTPGVQFDTTPFDWLTTMDSERYQARFPHPGVRVEQTHLDNFSGPELSSMSSPQTYDQALQLLKRIQNYTRSQQLVFRYIANCIKNESKIHLCILGDAGVGKTSLLNDLIDYYELMTSGFLTTARTVRMAYTANAALKIRGRTIHSTLGFLPTSGKEKKTPDTLRDPRPVVVQNLHRLFHDVLCVFIDEISMISAEMLHNISRRLTVAGGCPDPHTFMGGFDVIMAGDLSQLRPIRGQPIYDSPFFQKFKFFELKENVRHMKDLEWASLLHRLRSNELNQKDQERLHERITRTPMEFRKLKVEQFLFTTNKQVDEQNEYCLSTIKSHLFTIDAIDSVTDATKRAVPITATNYVLSKKLTGQLLARLQLKVGARVAITRNVSPSLPNGTIGELVQVNLSHGDVDKEGNPWVTSLDIRTLDPEVAEANDCSPLNGCIRIERMRSEFYHTGLMVERRQFPVCLSFASTIHRAQGVTLTSVAIDLSRAHTKRKYAPDRSLGYVALSRVTSIQNLYLKSRVDAAYLRVDPNPKKWMDRMADEMERFREMLEKGDQVTILGNWSILDTRTAIVPQMDLRKEVFIRFGLEENLTRDNDDDEVIPDPNYYKE